MTQNVDKQARRRLQRGPEGRDAIEKAIRDLGLDPQIRPNVLFMWTHGPPREYVGAFRWVAHKGWRLELVQPTLHSHEDLSLAVDEIRGTREAILKAGAAWEKFTGNRSDKTWGVYLGTLAAHYLRSFQQPQSGE